jgi:hypothetical protein
MPLPRKFKHENALTAFVWGEAIAVPARRKRFPAALWTNKGQISPTVGQLFRMAAQNWKGRVGIGTKRVVARFLLKFPANLSG